MAAATTKDVPVYVQFAGTLVSYVNADVRARVAGTLLEQNYRDGSFVQAGQLLFTIDPAPLRAARLEAAGMLEQARAAFEKANADVGRYGPLVEKKAATKEQLDNAVAARHTAEGQIASAKGALDQADLNLGYTWVKAPVSGIADIAQVRVGNLVGQGAPTLLTTVSTVDPLRFVFQIAEGDYLEYSDRLKELSERPLDQLERPSDDPAHSVELMLVGERPYPYRGYLAVVASQVDPTTGTLTLQALFPNPDTLLRPGQYGRVRFRNVLRDAVVIPQRAVQELQGKHEVAIIGQGDKAEMRSLELGPTTGAFVVVHKGLATGERIVIDGVQKVVLGQPVTPTAADTSSLPMSSAPVPVPTPPPPPPAVGGGPKPAAPSPSAAPPQVK
ncbi:MAG TPA: efflux RND transporter periplasmic adaptor subunit [Polyangiaceae bacterium]|nr:efflux RND transporter periplasmic adaptor subunit [Polyangiaceae bacterium]